MKKIELKMKKLNKRMKKKTKFGSAWRLGWPFLAVLAVSARTSPTWDASSSPSCSGSHR
jgi:hypothetical protein